MDSYFDSAIEYNRSNPISLARTSSQAQTVQNEKNWEWSYLVVSASSEGCVENIQHCSGGKFYSRVFFIWVRQSL